MIYKLTLSVDYIEVETFKHLSKWTNQSELNKSPKLLSQQIKKCYNKTSGTSIEQPKVPFLFGYYWTCDKL